MRCIVDSCGDRGWEGHLWADPSVTHLRRLMRHVFEHPDEARRRGQQARLDIDTKYSIENMGLTLRGHVDRIRELVRKKKLEQRREDL